MGVFSNRVERSELALGDHIYTWRTLLAYSHHGIYVGGSKVVHFTQQNILSGGAILSSAPFKCSSSASNANECLGRNVSCGIYVTTSSTKDKCAFQQKESGVVLSCLNCFLDGGQLRRYEYGVSSIHLLSRIRGGTCTAAPSDPLEEVIYRAMYLLQHGFGNYDLTVNNCEDFAVYCKTSLRGPKTHISSSQANYAFCVPFSAIVSSLFMSNPPGLVVASSGMYCFTRYATDIGVRSDVTKVEVEELEKLKEIHH